MDVRVTNWAAPAHIIVVMSIKFIFYKKFFVALAHLLFTCGYGKLRGNVEVELSTTSPSETLRLV